MKIEPEQITLKGKVVAGMLPDARYIKDERNLETYPGMLRGMGLTWEPGDELEITIRRVKHES